MAKWSRQSPSSGGQFFFKAILSQPWKVQIHNFTGVQLTMDSRPSLHCKRTKSDFSKSLYFNFVFSSILVFVTRWEYLAIDEGFIRTRINWKSMCYLFHCYYAQSRVLCFWRRGRSSNAFTFFPYKVHLINHDMAARVIQKHHRVASAVTLAGRRKKTILLYINDGHSQWSQWSHFKSANWIEIWEKLPKCSFDLWY